MPRPKQGHNEPQPIGCDAERGRQSLRAQCSPHNSQQRESCQRVHKVVGEVIPDQAQPAEGVIDSQAPLYDGPRGVRQWLPHRPETADILVVQDPWHIIKNKGRMQVVAVNGQNKNRQHNCKPVRSIVGFFGSHHETARPESVGKS
jgi:hypothetical protein